MEKQLVYLNGEFKPLSEAQVSVLDRGFIFGDGIYDVVPVYGRKMFRADQHFERLTRSLAAVSIKNPYPKEQWIEIIKRLIEKFDADDQMAYIQVTRGVADRAHAFPISAVPTVFIMIIPFPAVPKDVRARGITCVTMQDNRWLHCNIKSTSLLGNVLAAQHAVDNDSQETIQFRGETLTEASASNVWIVKNGVLAGPKKDNLVLEGIRYGLLEELCSKEGLPFEMRDISRNDVFDADEVLLSSAGKEIVAVTQIDGQGVADGKPGPMYSRLYSLYQREKEQQY